MNNSRPTLRWAALVVFLFLPDRIEACSHGRGERSPGRLDTILLPDTLDAADVFDGVDGSAFRADPGRRHLEPWIGQGGGRFVPSTRPGQWIEFAVGVDRDAWFDASLQVRALFPGRHVEVVLDSVDTLARFVLPDPDGSWQLPPPVPVRITTGTHRIRVRFPDGGTAFHRIGFGWSLPVRPGLPVAVNGFWPVRLHWSAPGPAAAFDLHRMLPKGDGLSILGDTAFLPIASTTDTAYRDAPRSDSAYGHSSAFYFVRSRNGSLLSPPSDTLRLQVEVAGWTHLPPIAPRFPVMHVPGGGLVSWSPVPEAFGYSVQIWQGTQFLLGTRGTTDTTFLDSTAVPGRQYRVYASNPYYPQAIVGGWTTYLP